MDKYDERQISRILDCLPEEELDQALKLIGKKAVVTLLFSNEQRAELERQIREEDAKEADCYLEGEVADIVKSLKPTRHDFLDFFDGWTDELFGWFFPDGSAQVILGNSQHDEWLAKEMVDRAEHVAIMHSLPEVPPYGPNHYLFFLVEWRRNVLHALEGARNEQAGSAE